MTVAMLATRGTAEHLSRGGWICEEKSDGWRAIATRSEDRITLTSRQGTDITGMAPEVCAQLLDLPLRQFVLDCELVAYDGPGPALLRYLMAGNPRSLVAFDILEANGSSVRAQPLSLRKQLLRALIDHAGDRISESLWTDENGGLFYEDIVGMGGEGVICKRSDSVYSPGRTKLWVKWKEHYA